MTYQTQQLKNKYDTMCTTSKSIFDIICKLEEETARTQNPVLLLPENPELPKNCKEHLKTEFNSCVIDILTFDDAYVIIAITGTDTFVIMVKSDYRSLFGNWVIHTIMDSVINLRSYEMEERMNTETEINRIMNQYAENTSEPMGRMERMYEDIKRDTAIVEKNERLKEAINSSYTVTEAIKNINKISDTL